MVPGEMTVTVSKKEVVAAALPMQDHWLPLSNLDLLLPPLDVGVFFCYKKSVKSVGTTNDMVGALKVALAQTLVSYYAFAGEVVVNSAGEPEILCNNSGVDFVEASADIELCQLDLHNPDFSIQGKLVPSKKRGVLAVQVTELKCGAMVVACTFDHRVADAYSANMFLVSWAETARSSPLSILPSFRRSVLSPRRPLPAIDPSFNDLYVPVPKLPPPPSPTPEDGNFKVANEEEQHINGQNDDDLIMTSRIYYVTADQLSKLQQLTSSSSGSTNNGCKTKQPTKLESFSSLLWKLISKFAISNEDSNRKKMMSRMGIVVDGRGRLGDMEAYFGNVLSISFGERSARELAEMPLGRVAQVAHQFLEEAATKEHFLGLIDWVEARRPEPNMAKIYFRGQGEEGWPAFVVSSGQRFPITEVDFGWGKPVFGSYHFPWGGDAGYVMPMPSPLANGDWIVYLHLPKSQLDFVQSEAAHVFHPLTPQYLSLN